MAEREEDEMREKEVLERAFAMPLTNPAYPPGPYRFVNREYLIITYRTDAAKLRAVVPDPLELSEREPLVVNMRPSVCRILNGFLAGVQRKGPGDPGVLSRPARQDILMDVPQRRGTDRRRARALGFSQRARATDVAD